MYACPSFVDYACYGPLYRNSFGKIAFLRINDPKTLLGVRSGIGHVVELPALVVTIVRFVG